MSSFTARARVASDGCCPKSCLIGSTSGTTTKMDRPWERLNHALRRLVRRIIGKQPELSLGIMDNQIVKATGAGSEQGYDDGKKMNERKRHILIDTFGLLLVLVVHAANIQDYDGA